MNKESQEYNDQFRAARKAVMDEQKIRLMMLGDDNYTPGKNKKEVKMREAKVKEGFPVTPVKSNVFVREVEGKGFYTTSKLILNERTEDARSIPVFEVVAYGSETQIVEIGDVVMLNNPPQKVKLEQGSSVKDGFYGLIKESFVVGHVDESKLVNIN